MLRMPKISLLMLAMMMASAMPMLAKEQYVDPVFGDTIDRTAEDFVIVSLVMADPGPEAYSVYGHLAIRMLCPIFNLDKCFTYNMIVHNEHPMLDFICGKLQMGMIMYETDEYCHMYAEEGRGVYEYKLNLPPNIEQELWRVLDDRVVNRPLIDFDYYHHTCAIECVRSVKEALGSLKIDYDESLFSYAPTGRELGKKYTDATPWVQLAFCMIAGSEVDVPLHGDKQLLMPVDVISTWQKATINGMQLLSDTSISLVEGSSQLQKNWFTPMVLALLILCLSVANLFWNKPYFDWLMLAAQTVVGAFMMYLICFSDLCCTSWNWLIIPFNILPAIFWYWRKYWALPCACALLIWCGVMAGIILWGRWLCGWSHILLVLTWSLVLIKQSLVRTAK